jgi:hypothetical protein
MDQERICASPHACKFHGLTKTPMPDSTTLHPAAADSFAASRAPLVLVSNHEGMFSLLAAQNLRAGQHLFHVDGELTNRASRYSVQVGQALHIDLPSPPRILGFELIRERHPWCFLNHGCEPNAHIKSREVFVLRDIAAGEQITFDYNTTEWEMAEAFRCHCGASGCRGEIRGYKFLSPEARARLGDAAAEYLRRM